MHEQGCRTMKKVVPAGIVVPLYGISLILTRGKQIGITYAMQGTDISQEITPDTSLDLTVQNLRISLTRAVI